VSAVNVLYSFVEWALGGTFGKKVALWTSRMLVIVLMCLAYFAPTRDIIWIANSVGQWKIGPFIHALQHQLHLPVTPH
jgi:hypothetical protein